jgi:hypothetical protein
VVYRLAEITVGGVTLKKSVHEVEPEQARRESRTIPTPRDPVEDEPLDDEVLFHSSFEPRRTVENLIAKAEAAKGPTDA